MTIPNLSSHFRIILTAGLLCAAARYLELHAQSVPAPAGTSTDLFVMFGSDIDRPGLQPRANYNIGIGHTFASLKHDLVGDELTFGYTYENSGSHGFLHTNFGEHTESGVQGAVERKTGLSGTQILARMNSQTADGQIESAYAVLGYTIRSSQLRCTHLGYAFGTSAGGQSGRYVP